MPMKDHPRENVGQRLETAARRANLLAVEAEAAMFGARAYYDAQIDQIAQ